jgi:integrase/recombinase XerC
MLENFESYLISEKRCSSHTLTAYINDVNTFLVFSSVETIEDLKEVNYQVVRAWLVELVNSNLNNRSVNRKLSSLRTFFKWALRSSYIEVDPMLRIRGPKQKKRLPEFVKEEELNPEKLNEVFPDTFEGFRDRMIIEVFYQTGIRLSELIELKKSDIQNGVIKVLGKRNKERLIPITAELERELKTFIDHPVNFEHNANNIFLTEKGNKIYPKLVYRRINYYLSLLTDMQKKSPHVLRHTFATHMLNNGAGLETLKEVLGHANLSATQIYTHNSFDEITKIYKQAHPRGHKN